MLNRLRAKLYAREVSLWYQIKKLGLLPMDKHCILCKNTLKGIKHRPLNEDEVLLILPQRNHIGGIRAFHIGRANKTEIEATRIYKDLEEQ